MIRILVAEDMRILRDTLVAVLKLEGDLDVVAAMETGDDVVSTALAYRPDVAVIAVDLPSTDGIVVAAELHERLPECRTLILTGSGRPGDLRRALAARVHGFIPKDAPVNELIDAVRTVSAGGRAVDPQLALAALDVEENPLSRREAEVLKQFSTGSGAAEIADGLCLSYGTVRNYLASAVTKLNARNRVDAVRIATEAGWL
ncbi:response regulator transcription factor [Microtetraspora malaysiensis]|uniref:response regulator transcription factor n=1 Tax=Microtetraspora malaysiensis TaxID=161358 RepID=UPI003D8FDE54